MTSTPAMEPATSTQMTAAPSASGMNQASEVPPGGSVRPAATPTSPMVAARTTLRWELRSVPTRRLDSTAVRKVIRNVPPSPSIEPPDYGDEQKPVTTRSQKLIRTAPCFLGVISNAMWELFRGETPHPGRTGTQALGRFQCLATAPHGASKRGRQSAP